jgi:hypothetical protein
MEYGTQVKNICGTRKIPKVSNGEFKILLKNFDKSLKKYDEIWFYYNPGRFHPLYKKLIKTSSLKNRIKLFTHLEEIVK